MKFITLLYIGIIATTIVGASRSEASTVSRDERGVTVKLDAKNDNEVRRVRLQVITPKVIRVSATPDAEFADEPSLVTVACPPVPGYKVKESRTEVSLITSEVKAVVSRLTGDVKFYDRSGRLILSEAEGGREFSPIRVEGTDGYTVRQVFSSLSDSEGLYGLGQHQSDEFNYKGRDEELFQYNTKVSVPFIVSTDNYGILWDSYSLCRFGNPKPYSQLGQVFKLYDKDGRPGALTGSYTPKGASEPQIVQREDSIYFEHLIRKELTHVVNLPRDFNYSGSHVVYEGEIEAPVTADYKFILYYSGYITVEIDGREVVGERWRTSWNPNAYKFRVPLEGGKRVPIRISWTPNGSVAYCGLRAYSPRSHSEEMDMSWWGEMQSQIDYYFIYGDDMDDVIAGYRTLTGRAPIMAKWVTGYWQSREKYNTAKEVLSTLAEFRRRQIPIDNIVIDWLHWPQDAWGSHEFDRKRFPDPKGMVDSIHAMHGRVMISVWPKFYVTTDHYKEFDSRGWMYKLPVQDSIRDWVGPGYLGSFYDAYHPEARRLFWSQMRDHYYPLGIDAWWMDASEPNIRDCTDIQYRKDLITPTALGPSTKYFNAYGLMNAEAIYDGQRSVPGDSARVFLLTRSGFAGQQRYSTATWSGDIATRWEDLKAQISAGLNFAASGIPWWSQDIGGFCVEDRYVAAAKRAARTGEETPDMKEWRELNTRWYQFGAFSPIFRAHGQWPYREIFNIAPEDHPAYRSVVWYTRLRYALMPYIYSLAARVHFDHYTIMRPLVMDFASDKTVRDLGDEYMFGPALLVSPVYRYGARSRQIYFPSGALWYDFYTGRAVEGGRTLEADAPYERIPLYARSGSIVPVGPQMQWSDEKAADVITLYVYAGDDGEFTLYEDEGTNYNYEKGAYATIPLRWNDRKSTLTIGERRGEFPGMLRERRFVIVKVTPDAPRGYSPEDTMGVTVDYDGRRLNVKI